MLKKSFVVLCAVLLAVIFTTSCSMFRKGDQARVKCVLVSGNYLEPRLLCELTQDRTKQPVLIYDNSIGGNGQLVYFSGNRKSTSLTLDKFSEFLEFLNPKIVVFVGTNNGLYYPTDLVVKANEKFRTMILGSDDWNQNCQTLADFLDINRLPREYEDLLKCIKTAEKARAGETQK